MERGKDSAFPGIANELVQAVDLALPTLTAMPDRTAGQPRGPGKWSPKQIIGHLIDSAANNHHRLVRAQQGMELVFPGYEQEHWVACQQYDQRTWEELTTLWANYNRHVAHVIECIPHDRRQVSCVVGSNDPVTLEFLARDYVAHLRHHLAQLGAVPDHER